MATQPQHSLTFDEYLALERKADYKSEFHCGQIYATSGGTEPHSRLSVQALVALYRHFSSCRVYDSNLKLYIQAVDRCVYPDAMVLCGEPHFHNDQQDVITNPLLVVEVLSPSTVSYDRGAKTEYYRSVPSIDHILLISQDRIFAEHFARQPNQTWIITPYGDRSVSIPLLGTALRLEEI